MMMADMVYAVVTKKESPVSNETEGEDQHSRLFEFHTHVEHTHSVYTCACIYPHTNVCTHTCRNPLPHPHTVNTKIKRRMYVLASLELTSALRLNGKRYMLRLGLVMLNHQVTFVLTFWPL